MKNFGFTPKPIPSVYLVICGNYREFNEFCNQKIDDFKNGETFFEGDEFVYYSHTDSIRGLRFDGVIYFGTYFSREDIDYDYINSFNDGTIAESCDSFLLELALFNDHNLKENIIKNGELIRMFSNNNMKILIFINKKP